MRLTNRVAIVTGAGTGIGKAIAASFAKEGAAIVATARTLSRIEQTAEEIRESGGLAIPIQCDVSQEEQVRHLVSETVREFGQVDVLVNDHGVGDGGKRVVDMDLTSWNEAISVNLTGTMLCCREVLKVMIPRKCGSIINIGSMAGMYGVPGLSPYAVSKWGVIGLTETLAIEVGVHNVRVNAISPAATRTDRFEGPQKARAKATGIPYENVLDEVLKHYALKRIAEPSEIAAAALFFASDESSAITGQNLAVSCGFHALHP